jgi:sugar phosphate isomerase/epimerase
MRTGVCTGPENAREAVPGLDYIEPTVGGLLMPAESSETFGRKLGELWAAAVPAEAVNCLFPRNIPVVGPDVDQAKIGQYARTVCRRAARAGVRRIVFGSGGARRIPEGFSRSKAEEQLVETLKIIGPVAAEDGVMVVLEPLAGADCNFINTVDEGAEAVRAADHPAVRLLADTYHMGRDGDRPDSIRRAGELIQHVHCAEVDGRTPPGTRNEDFTPYLKALKDIGYQGRISIEASWEDLPAQMPAALETLRKQIAEA